MARVLATIAEHHPETLTLLRRRFPRAHCASRLVTNVIARDAAILRNLHANLDNQTSGRDVSYSITDWRHLSGAVESVLSDYWHDLTTDHRRSLASLLVSILDRIVQCDRDLYAGRSRTIYAGEGSGGNLFRSFLTSRAQPIEFLGPLARLDAALLAGQSGRLQELMHRYRANGADGYDAEQYGRVAQALEEIWNREFC